MAISVGATLLFTRDGGGGGSTTASSPPPSDIASANDTGPVAIIMSEPTCGAFASISNSVADIEEQGWGAIRKELGPVAEWTSEDRLKVQAVATAMRNAADQVIPLAKRTPNRLVRELYEQFIAYGRAYADSVSTYSPSDDGLASANVNASSAISGICNTIDTGSANRGLGVALAPAPTADPEVDNPSQPRKLIQTADSQCAAWISRLDQFNSQTTEWAAVDPSIPASQWTPERRALEQSVHPLISAYADDAQAAGRQSRNTVLEDFAVAAALYLRAYVMVGDNYVKADGWLSYTGFRFANLISGACRGAAA